MTGTSGENTIEDVTEGRSVASAPFDRIVPKFCTTISLSLLNNRNLIMSLLYTEGGDDTVALIDRVMIDRAHATQLHKTLGRILEESADENTV